MAFTQPSVVTNNIAALNPEPNDVGGLTAAQLQAKYDQFGVDFQAWFKNTHLAELASIVLGSSASEYLGSATIAGLTGNTIYAQLVSLLAVAQAAQAGAILPGTITDTMLSNLAGQIKDTMTKHLVDYVKQVPYAVDSGVANAYVVTLSPVPTAYVDGMAVAVKIGNASTGASTLNVNALGVKPILDSLGNAITSGGLKAGIIYSMRYNATTGNFIVQGKGGGGNATAAHLLLGDTATVDTGQITGTMPSKLAENLGTLGATLLNFITNGNLANGTTGWTTVLASTVSVVTGYLKLLADATNSEHYAMNIIATTPIAGHKYYVRATLQGVIGQARIIVFNLKSDGTTYDSIASAGYTAETSASVILPVTTVNAAPSFFLRLGVLNASGTVIFTGAGEYGLFKNVVAIDLTAAFGAGLEPTQAQMDAIMTALGGWFDGNALLTKIASGGYINNGVLGTPEVLLNDPNHISANILSGVTDFGLVGTFSNIKSIQRGTLSLTAASQTVTISAVDTTKAIVKISYRDPVPVGQLRYGLVSAVITNPTTLTFAVNYYNSAIDVAWEVIEFNNVKSLQTGAVAANTDSMSVTIASVNTSKSIVFYSYTTSDSANTDASYVAVEMYISSATALSILHHAGGAVKTIQWQVIEFN